MMPIIKNEKPDSDVEEVSVSPDKKKSKMQKGAHLLNSRSVRISIFEFESDPSIFREATCQSIRKEITMNLLGNDLSIGVPGIHGLVDFIQRCLRGIL